MVDTKVNLCGIKLDNPIIPASGTFNYGYEFNDIFDINILGTFSFKGTTAEPRLGNPLPRIAECEAGLLNSVGLQNPGIEKVISHELVELEKVFHKKVMANICGFSKEEYVSNCEKIDKEDIVGWIELNVSCPNVKHGGMSFGTDPDTLRDLVRAVKEVTTKPLIVKLTPNVTDIVKMAKAAEDGGADGISLINTLLGMKIDLKSKKPVLANTTGGYSGPGVFPVALRMVYQVYEAVDIPIIGLGGVSSAEDVIEMIMAGATAVEIGSVLLVDPMAAVKIINDLPIVMDKYGIKNLEEIRGVAHNG
ncbi:MAG: dihydroorotate dehydrogenase [Erysipelotrichaceae bacterium]|nr:dihydroorotate dehydrogenase [Erysipelotrichaceae bacterium]